MIEGEPGEGVEVSIHLCVHCGGRIARERACEAGAEIIPVLIAGHYGDLLSSDVVPGKRERIEHRGADDVRISGGDAPVFVIDAGEESRQVAGGFVEYVVAPENASAELIGVRETMIELRRDLVVVVRLLAGGGEQSIASVGERNESLQELLRSGIDAAGRNNVAGEDAAERIFERSGRSGEIAVALGFGEHGCGDCAGRAAFSGPLIREEEERAVADDASAECAAELIALEGRDVV